jgi:hypothetical protein
MGRARGRLSAMGAQEVPEQTWIPRFRTPRATITKVLRSPSFAASRERAGVIGDDPAALRRLADTVETLDHAQAPLSAVADRVAAAVRFLRARADRLESAPEIPPTTGPSKQAGHLSPDPAAGPEPLSTAAGDAARERLIIAALDYLVTPMDLVPDTRVGGYIDDVFLLGWVFGAAVNELSPYLEDPEDEDPEDGDPEDGDREFR